MVQAVVPLLVERNDSNFQKIWGLRMQDKRVSKIVENLILQDKRVSKTVEHLIQIFELAVFIIEGTKLQHKMTRQPQVEHGRKPSSSIII